MKKYLENWREILFGVCWFSFLYKFSEFLIKLLDLKKINVVTFLDYYYPTIQLFIIPYISYHIITSIVPIFLGYKNKNVLHKYTANLIISSFIGFLIFVLFPTYVNRIYFKYIFQGNNLCNELLKIMHKYDSECNAIPSFHVLVSWLLLIGIRELNINKKVKYIICCYLFIICISTFLTRQHGVIDFPITVFFAEIVNFFVSKYSLDKKLFLFVKTKYFLVIKRFFYYLCSFVLVIFSLFLFNVIHYYVTKNNTGEIINIYKHKKEQTPKVSIIIPIYNEQKYIRQCLDSVVNQTLEDIEIICVNDGSKDKSLEILKEYYNNDSRIIIIDKENGGLGAARNTGMDNASGEFIMFLDSDDLLTENACEIAYNTIETTDSDFVSFGYNIFTDTNNKSYQEVSKNYKITEEKQTFYGDEWNISLRKDHPYVWNKIYKRQFIKKYKHINVRFFAEEVNLIYKIFRKCNKMTMIDDVLYKHRLHDNNLSLKRDLLSLYQAFKSFSVCAFDLYFLDNYQLGTLLNLFIHHSSKYNFNIWH